MLHANTPIAANATATNTTFGCYCHVQGIGRFWFMHRDLIARRTHAYMDYLLPDNVFNLIFNYLRAVGRTVLWSAACVCLCVCVLSARYLKNGFMDHHQIWWVGAGGEPLEEVQFWC